MWMCCSARYSKLLFSEKNLNAVLIGTGRLGRAISGYLSAEARGYHLMAAFDKSPDEIGRELQCGVMVPGRGRAGRFLRRTPSRT